MILIVYRLEDGEIQSVMKPAPPVGAVPQGLIPEGHSCIHREDDVANDLNADTHRVSADGRIIRKPMGVIEAQAYAAAMREVRSRRNRLLATSDWTQVPDSPHTAEQRQAWASYRQALRDLPENIEDFAEIVWPQPPT
ncbi:tail fiber assembly protein [Sulfitobacter sp. OXR-159]|uniref:tail fiber assembly protein n=1 Tax=Sulfitobacter sp. OXR-159 TaxID=3100174 RepID=UPI002AC8AB17|nr:tail fiber assembly protein [Sulfitobacter sp. OXR-159]WPZ30762.1 tail fiber assembly protein [Sulfitobacter sp. OXR-159]WPZ30863.1 tail fiber assembly protein [Sulfitobacter sp. OXR-159]